MTYKFYDTSSLLLNIEHLFDDIDSRIIISSISIQELENIKVSNNKDAEIKYKARKLVNVLNNNTNNYDIYVFKENMLKPIVDNGYSYITDDLKILSCAIDYDYSQHPDETVFVTNDLVLKLIANQFFGEDSIESIQEEQDEYTGYLEIDIDNDQELAYFYENSTFNQFLLLPNQYLILKRDNKIIDRLCWTGQEYRRLSYQDFNSRQLGNIQPYKNDVYQMLAADSLSNNQITMIRGPAGSGKSYLALGYLFSQLEKHKIEKIIIFCNTVATKDSAKLGYYPGTRDEKLLDSQIGNLLASKLGGRSEVEYLIQNEKLLLLPLSDIRGYDTSGMAAGIYISEAQNMSIDLMKLALQRIGEDSICIIDGDEKTQVDSVEFAGTNNGMRRASKVFRGHSVYGEIELKNIHRSKIAEIAQNM